VGRWWVSVRKGRSYIINVCLTLLGCTLCKFTGIWPSLGNIGSNNIVYKDCAVNYGKKKHVLKKVDRYIPLEGLVLIDVVDRALDLYKIYYAQAKEIYKEKKKSPEELLLSFDFIQTARLYLYLCPDNFKLNPGNRKQKTNPVFFTEISL
jgi:hypothetical protein